MQRRDLKTGMLVTLTNGQRFIIMRDTAFLFKNSNAVLIGKQGTIDLGLYDQNLNYVGRLDSLCDPRSLDIVKVEILSSGDPCRILIPDDKNINTKVIWERETEEQKIKRFEKDMEQVIKELFGVDVKVTKLQ